MPAQLLFRATQPDADVHRIVTQLHKLDGVCAVAPIIPKVKDPRGLAPKTHGVSGFVMFENPQLAAAARNHLPDGALFQLEDPDFETPRYLEPHPAQRG
jgi:hypothetical protein